MLKFIENQMKNILLYWVSVLLSSGTGRIPEKIWLASESRGVWRSDLSLLRRTWSSRVSIALRLERVQRRLFPFDGPIFPRVASFQDSEPTPLVGEQLKNGSPNRNIPIGEFKLRRCHTSGKRLIGLAKEDRRKRVSNYVGAYLTRTHRVLAEVQQWIYERESLELIITDCDREVLVHAQAVDDSSCLCTDVLDSVGTKGEPEREWFASSSPLSPYNVYNNLHASLRIVGLFPIECQEKGFRFLVDLLIVLNLLLRIIGMHDTIGAEAPRLEDLYRPMSEYKERARAQIKRTKTRMENGRSSVARLSPRAIQ